MILALDPQFSIDLQLIGGVIILQTLPAIVLGLYTQWFHRTACSPAGQRASRSGCGCCTDTPTRSPARSTSRGSLFTWSDLGIDADSTIYTGLVALG